MAIEIKAPAFPESVADGEVAAWHKAEGDSVTRDELLVEIETDKVVMEVVEADAVVKGQTASSSYKPAVLENGLKTLVPPHIEAGTRVVINTDDGSYVERAKD